MKRYRALPERVWVASDAYGGIDVGRKPLPAGPRSIGGEESEYVRADQLQGAVDTLRVLAAEVERLRGPHADLMGVLDAPITKALIAARIITGGQ